MSTNTTPKKRRLAMLPEVLPKPETVTPGFTSVRNRTLARLKVLTALTAAGVAASCSTGPSGDGSDGGLPDGGSREAGEDAYGVVDPLPRPSCFDTGQPTGTAKYTNGVDGGGADAGGDGSKLVEVDLVFKQTGVVLGTLTSTSGVTLVANMSSGSSATLVLKVPAGITMASVQMQASCSEGPTILSFTLQLAASSVTLSGLGN